MGRLLYYLDGLTDETVPCECTLEAWAAWLMLPADHEDVRDWGRDDVVADGAEFTASVLEVLEDLQAERTPDGWRHSRTVEGDADFFALRPWGPSSGWEAETSTDELDHFLELAIDQQQVGVGDRLLIAVGRARPDARVRFTREPTPICNVVGAVQ